MVNLVAAQKRLLHWLVKMAGLRQQTVEIEPGTLISFWLPKDMVQQKTKCLTKEIVTVGKTDDGNNNNKNKKVEKPAVVLVHGFAAEGIMTWQLQVRALAKKYAVYVPDLLFFGGSVTEHGDRSPGFQAECLTTALELLGVERCTVVGFSYGGFVAFKMTEARPDMVQSLVVSGSAIAMTDSISDAMFERIGFSSAAEFLLPESVKGVKALFSVATYKKLWLPDRLYRDYLKVMFDDRKEKKELPEGMVISNKDAKVPTLPQRILLLWGENDNIFNLELAHNMKKQLGDRTKLEGINKAGHLVHLERPCVYIHHLKEFLAQVYVEGTKE